MLFTELTKSRTVGSGIVHSTEQGNDFYVFLNLLELHMGEIFLTSLEIHWAYVLMKKMIEIRAKFLQNMIFK